MLVALLVAASLAVSAPAARAACGWDVLKVPTPGTDFSAFAMDASYASRKLGWLIGYHWESRSDLFSMRWNGVKWKLVDIPTPKGEAFATSVAALPDGTAWVVGTNSVDYTGFRLFFNGTKWIKVKGPSNEPVGTALSGVAAFGPKSVWAVGNTNTDSVIERWNGKRWSMVDHPDLGTASQYLDSISIVPGTKDLWAVGGFNDGPIHPMALHRTGGVWVNEPVPDPGQATLQSVDASGPGDAWLAGYRYGGSYWLNETWHWDGASWTAMTTPSPSTTFPGQYLHDVGAISQGNAYAAGYFYPVSGGNEPYAIRWDGLNWGDVSPASGDESFEFRGVAKIPGTKKVSLIGFELVGGNFQPRVVTGC